LTTAQLELKEAAWWGKRHQKWPENGFASLKSGIFVLSVGRRPYHVSICAIARLPVKPNVNLTDVDLEQQTVRIERGEKNGLGRIVYFSADARLALEVGW